MAFYNTVRMDGYDFADFQFTVKLAAGIVAADIGKPLTIDSTAANTMKLAGAGDPIEAVLLQVEDRTIEGILVGTVSFKFAKVLAIKSGLTGNAVVALGSRVVGAGGGEIQAIANTDPLFGAAPRVWEIRGSTAVVLKH